MRHVIRLFVFALICSIGALGQATKPPLPRTVTEVLDRSVTGAEKATIALAEAMPEEKYSFIPQSGEFKGVRNFGELVKHVAVDNYVNGAALLNEKLPIDAGQHENGPRSVTTKPQILKLLRNSFAYLHKAIATVNDKNLMERVEFEASALPRLMIVTAAISHPWDLYGQMIEYLRMNGIDPQHLN